MSVLDRDPPTADRRIPYGPDESQFGDLWLPRPRHPETRFPVVVFLHGGWWSSGYDLGYGNFLCRALRDHRGVAVWSLEYRRTGSTGGGWPATFEDVAAGFDHLRELAQKIPLDLTRVVVAGHSAGGHLAFWLAGRPHIPRNSRIRIPPKVPLRGVVALAGAVDLGLLRELSTGKFAVDREWIAHLMGGSPAEYPDRYAAGDPGQLLPLPCPQALVQGTADLQIPPSLPNRWAAKSRPGGVPCSVTLVPDADHFDVVDPDSRAWPAVQTAILNLLE